jgi:hypothetical protein
MNVRPMQPATLALAALLRDAHDAAAERLLRAAAHHLEQAAALEREAAEPGQEEVLNEG